MKKVLDVLKKKIRGVNTVVTYNQNSERITLSKKIIVLFVIVTFLWQMDFMLLAQSNDEIQNQFQRAAESYKKGQKVNALKRLEGIVGIILEKNMELKEIMGRSFLLMGAIYEKDSVNDLAVENYKKAVDECHVTQVPGIDLNSLPLYKKHVLSKMIFGPGTRKKKKFPWFLVAAGAVLVGATVYILIKKSKKYTLTINTGEGVTGVPIAGNHIYRKNETVPYSFSAQNGYGNLSVRLDGVEVAVNGTVTMNKNHTLTVSADKVGFITNTDIVNVPENGTATFTLRLSAKPQNDVVVTVNNAGEVSDDMDLQVTSGNLITFTQGNYQVEQTVVLYARSDDDIINGEAHIRIQNPGGGIPDKIVLAKEIDNDSLGLKISVENLVVRENEDARFQVSLISAPTTPVTVTASWVSGDKTVTIPAPPGGMLTFNAENFRVEQSVTVYANHDPDTVNGYAVIRVSAADMEDKFVYVTVIDDDAFHFVIDPDHVEFDEGASGIIQVKISAAPISPLTVQVSTVNDSSSDITLPVTSLIFDASNYDTFQDVTVSAAKDDDALNDTGTIRFRADGFTDIDVPVTVIDKNTLSFEVIIDTPFTIPETETRTFQVRLTAKPTTSITANVIRFSGDTDISITSNPQLVFSTSDWSTLQTVTVQAAKDEDPTEVIDKNGVAVLRISAQGVKDMDITATELDNGFGAPPQISIKDLDDGDIVSGDVTINVVARDDFGVKKVEFYVDDILKETVTVPAYRYDWSTANVLAGPHQIKTIVYDFADQIDTDSISVTVVDNPPTVTGIQLTPNTSPLSGTVKVAVYANDYKGVGAIRLYLGTQLVDDWHESPQKEVIFNVSLNTTLYPNGTYTLSAIAVDTATQESVPFLLENVIIAN